MARRWWLCVACAAGLAAIAGCGPSSSPPETAPNPDGWREFSGTWTAAGTRHALRLDGERTASVVRLSGTMLLAGPSRPGIGFRADVVALGDTKTGLAGRAVWTDENGDRVFSELRGEGTAARNRVTGTFLGGTGRYAGATGDYEFAWQYVVESDDGNVQGRAIDLRGRVRVGPAPAAAAVSGVAR